MSTKSVRTAVVSSLIAAIFFIFKDKNTQDESYNLGAEENVYRYIDVDKTSFSSLKDDNWKIFILKSVSNEDIELLKKEMKNTNVATLRLNSFEKIRIATSLEIKTIPEIIFTENGCLKKTMKKIDFETDDFWRALEIHVLLLYLKVCNNINDIVKEFFDRLVLMFDGFYAVFPVFNGFVFYF